jgi:hypothetical protein
MSVFRGTIRPPAVLSDEAIDRYLTEIRARLDPDPLFRRRLRGVVMNHYVAGREGMVAAPRHRGMGRLGRAVLYASFTLALSATTVLAASREALPGDPLYALKRQVEDLRFEVLPADLHDDLAAYALAERIEELARLAERGDWAMVESLAITVERDFAAFVASNDADRTESSDMHLTVLNGLLDRLPDPARDAVEAVIDRASVRNAMPPARRPRGGGNLATGHGEGSVGTTPAVGGSADNDEGAGSADRESPVSSQGPKSPKPDPTPLPEATPRPEPPSRAPSPSPDDANQVEVDGSED